MNKVAVTRTSRMIPHGRNRTVAKGLCPKYAPAVLQRRPLPQERSSALPLQVRNSDSNAAQAEL